MSASPGRLAALETVSRVRTRNAYAHETLDAVLKSRKLTPQDVAFATRLAYGTIATRGTLDEALARYTSRPGVIEPTVGDALAVAAYELLFARTPARAAVSQGVDLVRSVQPKAAGLANAVLRRLAEDVDSFPWGDPKTDVAALARLHGHPQWLADLWVKELGFERAGEVMSANNEPAPLFLARLPHLAEESIALLQADGVDVDSCGVDGCFRAADAAQARKSRMVRDRRVLVMDAAAQFVVATLKPSTSARIAEVGAGRGSKALLSASIQQAATGHNDVLGIDMHAFKLEALETAALDLGLAGVSVLEADGTDADALAQLAGTFDAVLVDAPCSGLGTLRRHPDRRWRARPEEIDALAALGSRLLERASALVTHGGCVVYSTCTISTAENDDVVDGFLGSRAGEEFELDSLGAEVPAGWERFIDEARGWFRSLPEAGGPDGHFVARMVRR